MAPVTAQGHASAAGHMKPSCRRVYDRLRAAEGGWVRGNDLALVGGWRFSARIYELRQMGHVIERRPDPNSAVDQYRLVLSAQTTLFDAA